MSEQPLFDKIGPAKFGSPADFWDPKEVKAMLFGHGEANDRTYWEVGLVFETKDYAEKVFAAIADWQERHEFSLDGSEEIDQDDAIRVSFIGEKDASYFVYIYPGMVGVEPGSLMSTTIIARHFPGPAANYKRFRDSYDRGLVRFHAFHWNDGDPQPIEGTKAIWKHAVKIKRRGELAKDELERMHHDSVRGQWDSRK